MTMIIRKERCLFTFTDSQTSVMPQHIGPQGTATGKLSRCREGWGLGAEPAWFLVEVESVSRVQAGRVGWQV